MGCCSSSAAVANHDGTAQARIAITDVLKHLETAKKEHYRLIMLQSGLHLFIDDNNSQNAKLSEKRTRMIASRSLFLKHIAERDADDIRRACVGLGTDKSAIVEIITKRTNLQLIAIDEIYKSKYKMSLLEQIRSEMKSVAGGIITGALSDLGEFLVNRCDTQPERDARFLRDSLGDLIGTNDKILIEVLCTRTNKELSAAFEVYSTKYKESVQKSIRKKITWKNYRDLCTRVAECRRDESGQPYDVQTAQSHAKAIKNAFAAQKCCCPVNGVHLNFAIGYASPAQIQSIRENYAGDMDMDIKKG